MLNFYPAQNWRLAGQLPPDPRIPRSPDPQIPRSPDPQIPRSPDPLLPEAKYGDATRRLQFESVLTRLQALPSVADVAATTAVPDSGNYSYSHFWPEHLQPLESNAIDVVDRRVAPTALTLIRVPLVAGRMLAASDRSGTTPVAVISQSLARKVWADRSPLGQRFRLAPDGSLLSVVGVVGDVKQDWIGDWGRVPRPHDCGSVPAHGEPARGRAGARSRSAGGPGEDAADGGGGQDGGAALRGQDACRHRDRVVPALVGRPVQPDVVPDVAADAGDRGARRARRDDVGRVQADGLDRGALDDGRDRPGPGAHLSGRARARAGAVRSGHGEPPRSSRPRRSEPSNRQSSIVNRQSSIVNRQSSIPTPSSAWPTGTRRCSSSCPSCRAAVPSPRPATAASGPCAARRRG